MSGVFPELEALSLHELQQRFRAVPPDHDLENVGLWYDDVAVNIRERDPDAGARFLRAEVDWEDPDRLCAILLAITWFGERDSSYADLAVECLEHPDELVVARAINDLAALDGHGLTARVLALSSDPRVAIRGAVLRFAQEVIPDEAPALLVDALDDPHDFVRWNAIAELVELEYTPAAVCIEALLGDPSAHVRAAALDAIAGLAPSSTAIPLLLAGLGDTEAAVRSAAIDGLDSVEQFNDRKVFERMLDDADEDVRWRARDALERHAA